MSIIGAFPFNLTNGTTADASQVMSNFNEILNDVNANAAHNGANSDITSITGLTIPLSNSQGGTGIYLGGTSTGSANAQVLATPVPAGFTLTAGLEVDFIAGFTNTGAVTLAVNGTTVLAIMKQTATGLSALSAGDIIAGLVYCVVYDGTQYQLITKGSTVPSYTAQLFTSSGTFTAPSATLSTTVFKMTLVGGGGSGGCCGATGTSAGGGGAGTTGIKYASGLTAGTGYAVTVGVGGAGVSSASDIPGNAGTASTVVLASTLTAPGGGAGGSSLGGVGGSAATNCDVSIPGQTGGFGYTPTVLSQGFEGAGGNTPFGHGGPGMQNNTSPTSVNQNGVGYGSGGGALYNAFSPGTYFSGNGAPGVVIIEWIL